MRVFIIKNESPQADGKTTEYAATLGEAHKVAKGFAKAYWPEVTVQEVNMQVDKRGVLAALAGNPIILHVERTWGLGDRGGLIEEK